MDCPVSAATSSVVINPPLTFVIDTTRSVKPDKDSIFNLTQRVVDRIQETNTNIPQVRQCAGLKYHNDLKCGKNSILGREMHALFTSKAKINVFYNFFEWMISGEVTV